MLPAHAQTSGTTLNSNGPITSGVAEVTDSDVMIANHESLFESFIPSAHAQASCAVIGQCATVNFIGDNGTVTVTNVGSGPFTLDESNIAGGTVAGIPFVLRLNADRMAGNLNFNGDCGGAGTALFPNVGCTPGSGESPETCSTINVTFSFTTTVIGNGAVGYDIYPAGGGGSIDGDGIGFFSNDVVNTTYSHTYAPGQYFVYAVVGGSPGSGSITGTGTVTCCTGDSETILNVDLTGDGVGQTGCALVTIGADGTCTVEPSNNCP
jgi:hypothetical protein